MAYYNTLGFDAELINYIDFVDDSFVDRLFDDVYTWDVGRKPHRPVTMFRLHYLYFIKPEITSFRQLEAILKNPKNQDYRNFIGVRHPGDVPSHNSMSDFRSRAGVVRFYAILFQFIAQALRVDGFMKTDLAAADSRPLYALVNGFKRKRCSCEGDCCCPKTYSDPDAGVGRQKTKVNGGRFFVGYRKHTIIVRSPNGPIPVISAVFAPKVGDNRVLLPLLKLLKAHTGLDLEYVVADLGYYDEELHRKALHETGTAVVTGLKQNAALPEEVNEKGQPECPQGERLVWDGFEDGISWFRGDTAACETCPLQAGCPQQFGFSFDEAPRVFSPIPHGTEIHEAMLNFRRQVELQYAQESNQVDSVLRHKKVPFRGLSRVRIFAVIADIARLVQAMLRFCADRDRPKDFNKALDAAFREQLLAYRAA
jgi:hypothetical protein